MESTLLESRVSDSTSRGPSVSCVRLRSTGHRCPLVVLHQATADALHLQALAAGLPADMPVVAIGLPTDGGATVEALAAVQLAALRGVQPHGPYRLLGHGIAGILAYELATQLLGDDQQVEFLGLVDTYRNDLQLADAPDETELLLELVSSQHPDIDAAALQPLRTGAHLGAAVELLRTAGLQQLRADRLQTWRDHMRGWQAATRRYRLQPLPLRVHLFHADIQNAVDPSHGWAAVLNDGLRAIHVGGTHYSMLRQPQVARLANQVSLALDEVDGNPVRKTALHVPLMPIQVGGPTAPVVYCVPGAGANITCFLGLAEALGGDATLLGLQPRGLGSAMVPHTSIRAAAKSYIEALRPSDRHGYILLGHSFGGWVAHEMACQLLAAGAPPPPLVLVDTLPPSQPERRYGKYGHLDALLKFVRLLQQGNDKDLQLSRQELEPLSVQLQIAKLRERMIAVGLLPKNTTLAAVQLLMRVFAAQLNTRYVPAGPRPQRLLLVQPQTQLAPDPDDDFHITPAESLQQWSQYAHVEPLQVPGNHMTMLQAPGIGAIAARVHQLWKERARSRSY